MLQKQKCDREPSSHPIKDVCSPAAAGKPTPPVSHTLVHKSGKDINRALVTWDGPSSSTPRSLYESVLLLIISSRTIFSLFVYLLKQLICINTHLLAIKGKYSSNVIFNCRMALYFFPRDCKNSDWQVIVQGHLPFMISMRSDYTDWSAPGLKQQHSCKTNSKQLFHKGTRGSPVYNAANEICPRLGLKAKRSWELFHNPRQCSACNCKPSIPWLWIHGAHDIIWLQTKQEYSTDLVTIFKSPWDEGVPLICIMWPSRHLLPSFNIKDNIIEDLMSRHVAHAHPAHIIRDIESDPFPFHPH